MTATTPSTNNKLVQYHKELIKEYVRENMFSPYMGSSINSIIRTIYDNKKGGEQVNIPLVTSLRGTAKSTGTLTGAEEAINNYGMRAYVDWARHAVSTTDADEQKDSADIFGEAKPMLSDWGKELQRDEIIQAFMSLPSESAPSGLRGWIVPFSLLGLIRLRSRDESDRDAVLIRRRRHQFRAVTIGRPPFVFVRRWPCDRSSAGST